MKGEIIKAKRWEKNDGRTASIYGACPWTGAPGDRETDWRLVTVGYTIAWPDGTVGCGRPPFDTVAEAEAYLKKTPESFRGMGAY